MVKRDYSMDGDGRISDDDVATYPTDGVANRDHRGKQVWVCTPGTSHVNVNSSLHLIDLFVEYGTVTVAFGHNAHNQRHAAKYEGATNHDDGQ